MARIRFKINKNISPYTSSFATTNVVVFLFVIAGGTYIVQDLRKIIKVVSRAARYGGDWSRFPDITR